MWLAIVLTIVFILVEHAEINSYKRNHRQDAIKWCADAEYRFKNHRDRPKIK